MVVDIGKELRMPPVNDREFSTVASEWKPYCDKMGRRFSEGIYDPDFLSNEALTVIWEVVCDGYEPGTTDFRKMVKTRIPHRLTDFVRKTKRACRRESDTVRIQATTSQFEEAGRFPESWLDTGLVIENVERQVEFDDVFERFVDDLSQDARRLLRLLVEGSREWDAFIATKNYQRTPSRPTRPKLAEFFGWTEAQVRKARRELRKSAVTHFDEASAFAG